MFVRGSLHRRRGAAILAYTLGLTMIATISSLLMARTLLDHHRMNERRRDLWRSFYFAESGIAQVQHWAMFPADYTLDTDLFMEVNETGTVAERFVNLADALAAADPDDGILISENNLQTLGVGAFTTESGWYLGKIRQIRLIPPDPANDPIPCFFKIQSIGQSAKGRERTVIGYANANPIIEIQIPAALISLTSASVYGNGRVHWGEAWSKTAFNVPNRSQMTYILDTPDPWAKYRTEATFNFPANWSTSATYSALRLYNLTADQPGLFPTSDGDWKDVFFQNVPSGTLQFPDFLSNYQAFKDLALANNRYYTTDASGVIYHHGEALSGGFTANFGVTSHSGTPIDLVFIDTLDGQPPASDGSNLATISVAGNGGANDLGLKGVYYIAANMDVSGVGGPPPLSMTDPNGTAVTQDVWLNGVLYAAGDIEFTGNPIIFGSVLAENGFSGGGTPDVYYNQDLQDGMILDDGNVGSPFDIVLHNNFAP